MTTGQARLIIDVPQSGIRNMAIDEAILLGVNDGISPATLRFYQWEQATISLGYFQRYDEHQQQHTDVAQMPVVRRQTGGGAILHDDELTYSVVLPLSMDESIIGIEALYQRVHDAIISALTSFGVHAAYRGGENQSNSQRGPFFCFERHHPLDLVVDGVKLVGSAQRRRQNAVLQHGSIILGRRQGHQPCTSLEDVLGQRVDTKELTNKLAQAIADHLELTFTPGKLSASESAAAAELESKYAGHQWNAQR